MELRQIPLSKLVRHPQNTRKQQDVGQLEASIRSVGVLSNLVGQELPDGTIGILGGWHRRRAVAAIVQAGDCDRYQGDPVLATAVFPADAAVSPAEITAAENFARADLHPADEFDAVKLMADEGLALDVIALKLGRDQAHISRLLKLADVAPSLVELFRQDKISLDQLKALALTSDHAVQEKVWKAARGYEQNSYHLKQAIMRQSLQVGEDPVARYVGVEAYKAAGGLITVDVFETTATEGYMQDAELARKLARAKLDQRVEQVFKDGWLWVEARLEFPSDARAKFGEAKHSYSGTKKVWAPNAKDYSGAVVTIDRSGRSEVVYGLVRAKDKKKREASDKAEKTKTKAAGAVSKSGATAAKKPAARSGKLTFATVQRLQGERTAILRAEVATNPRLALAALAADLVREQLFGSAMRHDDRIVRLAGDRSYSMNPNARSTLQTHPRLKELDVAGKKWKTELQPYKDDLLARLLALPESVTQQLLAYLVAGHISATNNFDTSADAGRRFLETAGVDMSKHWKPTAEWLETQPRAVVLAAVTEATDKRKAAEVEKAKGKAQFVAAALPVLLKAGWLPEPLRAPPTAKKRDGKQKAANDS